MSKMLLSNSPVSLVVCCVYREMALVWPSTVFPGARNPRMFRLVLALSWRAPLGGRSDASALVDSMKSCKSNAYDLEKLR